MIDILIIGNDPGLRLLVEKEGVNVCIYSDEIQALTAAKDSAFAIVLLSYDVRKDETPEYIALLTQANQTSKVVLIGQGLADEIVIDCLMNGAQGYISAAELPKFIDKMVNVLQSGEVWVTRRMAAKILERLREVL